MIERFEQFLFDIIGLFIPGFLFLLLPLLIIILAYDIDTILNLPTLNNYLNVLTENYKIINNSHITIFLILLFSYLFGHIVKVFSKIFYNFFKTIFDENINRLILIITKRLQRFKRKILKKKIIYKFRKLYLSKWYTKIVSYVHLIFSTIICSFVKAFWDLFKNIFLQLFIFEITDCEISIIPYRKKLINYLKEKDYIPEIPQKYNFNYSIYKISNLLQCNKNIKTLMNTFLAKYNFYRSLSFICFINILFVIYLLNFKNVIHKPLTLLILFLLLIAYYTFHNKYKRYWCLAGYEATMGLYYYFFLKEDN